MSPAAEHALAVMPVVAGGALAAMAVLARGSDDLRWSLVLLAAALAAAGYAATAAPSAATLGVAAPGAAALLYTAAVTRAWRERGLLAVASGAAVAGGLSSLWFAPTEAVLAATLGAAIALGTAGILLARFHRRRRTRENPWLWGLLLAALLPAALLSMAQTASLPDSLWRFAVPSSCLAATFFAAVAGERAGLHRVAPTVAAMTLLALALAVAAVGAATAAVADNLLRAALGAALGAAAGFAAAHLDRGEDEAATEEAIEDCEAAMGAADSFASLASALTALTAVCGVGDCRVLRLEGTRWHSITDEVSGLPTIDPQSALWMGVNSAPLRSSDLSARLLGGLLEPVRAQFLGLGARALIPLAHHDTLIGVIVAGSLESHRWPLASRALGAIAPAAAHKLHSLQLQSTVSQKAEVQKDLSRAEERRSQESSEEQSEGATVQHVYRPGSTLGGDFCVRANLPGGDLLVAVGSVAGTGTGAALLAAAATGALQSVAALPTLQSDPGQLLKHVDEALAALGTDRRPVSCFALLWKPREREIRFANAGHPLPYRLVSSRALELSVLAVRGNRLGLGGEFRAPVRSARITRPERLILGSEGLWLTSEEPRYLQRRIVSLAQEKRLAHALVDTAPANLDADVTCVVLDLNPSATTSRAP